MLLWRIDFGDLLYIKMVRNLREIFKLSKKRSKFSACGGLTKENQPKTLFFGFGQFFSDVVKKTKNKHWEMLCSTDQVSLPRSQKLAECRNEGKFTKKEFWSLDERTKTSEDYANPGCLVDRKSVLLKTWLFEAFEIEIASERRKLHNNSPI